MTRWLINLAAVVSLGLCVISIVIGVRSFQRKDKLEFVGTSGRVLLLISSTGRLDVLYNATSHGEAGFTHIQGLPSSKGATDSGKRILGFGGAIPFREGWFINTPYWFYAFVFALLPAIAARRERRRWARRAGLCRVCGYDLRASPGRCPECGAESQPARPA